jgi:uncharacterized RDD family membrane protein YckC
LANRASFGSRALGEVIDFLLYGALNALFIVVGVAFIITASGDCIDKIDANATCTNTDVNGPLLLLGIAIIAAGVLLVLFLYVRALGRTGQTWGRKIAKVKVVDQNTMQPLGFGRALGRTLFARLISTSLFGLGYWWMLWDDQKQTWHDKVVGSAVINA